MFLVLFFLPPALLAILVPSAVLTFEHVPENDLAKVCRPVNRPLDLLFLLDGSGSVGGSTFQTQMQLLNRLVDVLEVGPEQNQSQLAVMQYATYSFVEFPFSAHRNKSQLRHAIQRIRHKSGTTKTGKALEKAFQLFRDRASGARAGNNVAKVVVVVSDGRSQDDPVPSALRLRQSGISLIALGIGTHVNMAELLQMTGDSELAFDNQTLAQQSVDRFTGIFRQLATAELCEFARGGNGADIHCGQDAVEVRTSTARPFRGRFYVQGQWDDPECGIGAPLEGNGTELMLRIPLAKCGLERQFSTNPRGHYFHGAALLQFHQNFRTGADKLFPVLCFYRDHSAETPNSGPEESEIDWQLVKEHTQRKSRTPWGQLPCSYRLLADHMQQMAHPSVGGAHPMGCGSAELRLGQSVIHSWECDSDQFDVYQSILVHSCFLQSANNSSRIGQMLIDENGCSVEPNLMESPQYAGQLKAFARGVAIRPIGDGQSARLRCSFRFCDRLMGECDEMLPPKCGTAGGQRVEQANEKKRRRRQTGFPVLIRSLNGDGPAPPLVMFSKSSSKRRRPFPEEQRAVKTIPNEPVEEKTTMESTSNNPIVDPSATSAEPIQEEEMSVWEERRREEAAARQEEDAETTNHSDPFQGQEADSQGTNGNSNNSNNEEISLDPEVLNILSDTEMTVYSQEFIVGEAEDMQVDAEAGKCRRKRMTVPEGRI